MESAYIRDYVIFLQQLCIVRLDEMHTFRKMGFELHCLFSIPPDGKDMFARKCAERPFPSNITEAAASGVILSEGKSFKDLWPRHFHDCR